jgi:beta-glucosidase
LQGVQQRARQNGIEVEYCKGAEILDANADEIPAAAALAQKADLAIVVVGDTLEQIGEECDRSELDLSGGQQALLEAVKATGTPLVVVLINSKPLCVPWVKEHADAVLEAFNPGMLGGEAVAKLLFGDAVPMGKLTVSFAKSLGQNPVHYQQIPGWHGSKHGTYDTTPLWPFGFGLSYTRFGYSNLSVLNPRIGADQDVQVKVDVTNLGDRAGTEIAQLYLNDVFTTLSTPTKTLKGFARLELAAGETRTIQFTVPYSELSFVGRDGQPVFEAGEFRVLVGGSSQDADLQSASFELSP